ncbi:TerB family tellurite resistance protein [Bacillus subtilis]|uniref:tellurite resistance TerB family protein n=1 Tax=Pseudochrobactrum asaccharolyticum TaxID=354351 RepID=UPI001F314E25|nr:TerB family tellurite resistance protein [Pseudochrobactrum asaccharolyticum]MCF7644706.1 TerB family tellurite resistance protein [Pseudochrobactrum asaccharolyticum]MCF7670055.1 TerB family tellurite resistance protein [Bacillus subtilis]
MFERLISLFKELPGLDSAKKKQTFSDEDPRLAAAALMFHVIEADGEQHEKERKRLSDLLSQAYDLQGDDLQALIKAAEAADQESIDLYRFTSVLKRHLDVPARLHFIEVLWEMVYADGDVGEIEDNIMWRIAELIGVDQQQRIGLKLRVAERAQSMRDALASLPKAEAPNSTEAEKAD